MDNERFRDVATLAILPGFVAFDAEDVRKLVVPGASGRTIR